MRGLLLVAALAPIGPDWLGGAFVAGWVLRGMPDRSGPRVAAPLAAWLFCALVAGSIAGIGFEPGGITAGVRFIVSVALTAATVRIFRQRPDLAITLPVALTAGSSAAVFEMLVRASSIDPAASLASFGLVACLAGGMTARVDGRARLLWAAAAAWLIVGIALTTNRSPQMLSAFGRTAPLVEATLRVTESSRWFGIGIGRDSMANSHNLLAIGAELGLAGLTLWLVWIGAGLLRAGRALTHDPRDVRLWGAFLGVVFYIAALAVSRPLAFSETLFPFALQFGLLTGLAGSMLLEGAPVWTRRPRWQVAVTLLAMAAVAAGALVSARRASIAREPAAPQTKRVSTSAAAAAILRSR